MAKDMLQTILGINWRTTASAILPFFTAFTMVLKSVSEGQWPSHEDVATIASLVSIGCGLVVAKDKTVTGGSVSNVDGTSAGAPVSVIKGGEVAPAALIK